MTKIKTLNPNVISKIAAGEVVERPTNIVKELVENSIDANATSVNVYIEKGGIKSIRVQDNGEGIPKEDMEKAFELHTTSKLEENIEDVATLGFRGEALASIASVSQVMCKSKPPHQSVGYQLKMEGGEIVHSKEVQMSPGTVVEVSGIFFNTPARRKFLKTPATERRRIVDLLTNYSFSFPDLHFKLEEELPSGAIRSRVESPARDDLLSVIFDTLGAEIADQLLPVEANIGEWKLTGFISKPHLTRSDRSLQFISVNGRPIRHQELQSKVENAYGSQLMKSAHPVLIIKLSGPNEAIDFNVHPQKSEIRFSSSDQILFKLPQVIRNTLNEHGELPTLDQGKLDRVKQPKKSISSSSTKEKSTTSQKIIESDDSTSPTSQEKQDHVDKSSSDQTGEGGDTIFDDQPRTRQSSLEPVKPSKSSQGFVVLGHLLDKFGIIEYQDEMWLVDVHAADERVKFEMYEDSSARQMARQQLLEPLEVTLPEVEKVQLLDNEETLQQFGLRVSNGGKRTIMVHSVPVYYDQTVTPENVSNLLVDIISYLIEDSDTASVETPLEKIEYAIVSRLACHGAIRSGYKVSNSNIRDVVENLLDCRNPWTCAHGRPTVLRISQTKLEGWFNR